MNKVDGWKCPYCDDGVMLGSDPPEPCSSCEGTGIDKRADDWSDDE